MIKEEILTILTLEQIKGYGYKTINKILENKNSFSTILELFSHLETIPKLKLPTFDVLESAWGKAEKIIKLSSEKNITILSKNSKGYPPRLLSIANPPLLLHILGDVELLSQDSVAIIGTKNPSEYGLEIAKKVATSLANKYCIVSGLAKGIDTSAHKSTLNNNGKTIAVLAHGLDSIFPKENEGLAKKILKKGALISEYSIGVAPNKGYFIQRDRIQSGLSSKVIVIECGLESGTMHTANFSLDQGRELLVLKHPLDFKDSNLIEGNKKLIEKGAIPFYEDKFI